MIVANIQFGIIIALLITVLVQRHRAVLAAEASRKDAQAAAADAEIAVVLSRRILNRIEQEQVVVAANLSDAHERAAATASTADAGTAADAAAVLPPDHLTHKH